MPPWRHDDGRPVSWVQDGVISPLAYTIQPNGCWEWNGKPNRDGYGRIRYADRDWIASRLMFTLTHGYTPPVVRHTCDNPPCVNPGHLVAGTQRDNVRDMHERGRAVQVSFSGEAHPRAKLTLDQVREIRYRYVHGEKQWALAAEYGISTSQASNICSKRQWLDEVGAPLCPCHNEEMQEEIK